MTDRATSFPNSLALAIFALAVWPALAGGEEPAQTEAPATSPPQLVGTPLRISTRVTPALPSPGDGAFRLHRLSGRLEWRDDEFHGQRFVWWLDNAPTNELAFALRAGPDVRYALTCDYAMSQPQISITDMGATAGAVGAVARTAPSEAADSDPPPAEAQMAQVAYSSRTLPGGRRQLQATLPAAQPDAWRVISLTNPNSETELAVYGCEAAPLRG